MGPTGGLGIVIGLDNKIEFRILIISGKKCLSSIF